MCLTTAVVPSLVIKSYLRKQVRLHRLVRLRWVVTANNEEILKSPTRKQPCQGLDTRCSCYDTILCLEKEVKPIVHSNPRFDGVSSTTVHVIFSSIPRLLHEPESCNSEHDRLSLADECSTDSQDFWHSRKVQIDVLFKLCRLHQTLSISKLCIPCSCWKLSEFYMTLMVGRRAGSIHRVCQRSYVLSFTTHCVKFDPAISIIRSSGIISKGRWTSSIKMFIRSVIPPLSFATGSWIALR